MEESRYPSIYHYTELHSGDIPPPDCFVGWMNPKLNWSICTEVVQVPEAAALPRLILSVSKLLMKPDSSPLHILISIFQAAHSQLSWVFQQGKATHYTSCSCIFHSKRISEWQFMHFAAYVIFKTLLLRWNTFYLLSNLSDWFMYV